MNTYLVYRWIVSWLHPKYRQEVINYSNKNYYDIVCYKNNKSIGTVRMHTMSQEDIDKFQKIQEDIVREKTKTKTRNKKRKIKTSLD